MNEVDESAVDQQIVRWFLDNGLIRCHERDAGGYVTYGIAWSCRSGYDFIDLEFVNCPTSTRPLDWEVVAGHHQSGTNPRMQIGTCTNLEEIKQIFEAIRITNGYPTAEPVKQTAVDWRKR